MNDEQLEVVEADETEAELGVEVLNRLFVAPQWELLIWAVALSSLQVVYFDFLSLDWVICDLYELCLDWKKSLNLLNFTVDFFPSICFIPRHLELNASLEKLTKL